MDKENRPQRLEKAISYLFNNNMIDGTHIVTSISRSIVALTSFTSTMTITISQSL